jgi:Xaa-Pro aminopeptidase
MTDLVSQKVHQAIEILDEKNIDLWLTFVRETSCAGDPVLPLIYGKGDLTWQSGLFIARNGVTWAIVGTFDADNTRAGGIYKTVVPYDESIKPELMKALEHFQPNFIAVNTSLTDSKADGLSHGMYSVLQNYLKGTPYESRLVSAEHIIGALRERKLPSEVDAVKEAIKTTDEIFQVTYQYLRPGMTEIDISRFMHAQLAEFKVEPAWDLDDCPIVNAGPNSSIGHSVPGEEKVKKGELVHFDFGVKKNGFCSDLQRLVYMLPDGEMAAPEALQNGFNIVLNAVETAFGVMRPGIAGKEVDAAARSVILSAGFEEYKYATGHHLGREAHDGGGILGPEWERYGDGPRRILEPGNIFTIELGIMLDNYGYIGLEEDVLVTSDGAVWLSNPQRELILR